jgi:hypothetical protein
MVYIKYTFLSIIFAIGALTQSLGQISNYKAYSIYVYSFSKYINWPEQGSTDEFVITVVGKSKVREELETMAQTKNVGGKKIVIKNVNGAEEIKLSHIVYVSDDKSSQLNEVLAKVGSAPTLVIAERDGMAKKGASISFIAMEDNTLRFEVNEEALGNHRLKVSKNLLALAYKE